MWILSDYHEIIEILSVNKALRKFGGKGAVREKVEANSRVRRSKLVTSVRTNIMRRRLVNRNREAARRAKLMRRYFICISLSTQYSLFFLKKNSDHKSIEEYSNDEQYNIENANEINYFPFPTLLNTKSVH